MEKFGTHRLVAVSLCACVVDLRAVLRGVHHISNPTRTIATLILRNLLATTPSPIATGPFAAGRTVPTVPADTDSIRTYCQCHRPGGAATSCAAGASGTTRGGSAVWRGVGRAIVLCRTRRRREP